MKFNRWHIVNYTLAFILGFYIPFALGFNIDTWQWWGLVVIVVSIRTTAMMIKDGKSK